MAPFNALHLEGRDIEPVQAHHSEWSLDLLIDYIVVKHHAYSVKTLPHLVDLAVKVADLHGLKHPEFIKLRHLVASANHEVLLHQEKEEQVLFPLIKQIVQIELEGGPLVSHPASCIKDPIDRMDIEHGLVHELFEDIEALTNKFELPKDADDSIQVLYTLLETYIANFKKHHHLEHDILFPRALALESKFL